jgi:serine kinase of HPr protein (carbohydrate metabolism regulator)
LTSVMPSNVHATVLVLGDRGLLVRGRPGSGKTGLALSLLAHAKAHGLFARLVSDDQALPASAAGRLVCSAPETIRGLAEFRGIGPAAVEVEPRAVIDLIIELVPGESAPRMQDPDTQYIGSVEIPVIRLAEGDREAARLVILRRLGLPPFV